MGSQPLTTNLEVEILSNDLCLDRKINTTKSYLVREENTVCFVFVSRVNPRVANKVNTTMTGNIIKCERLKVEFTVVQASLIIADGLDCGHFVVLTSKEDW